MITWWLESSALHELAKHDDAWVFRAVRGATEQAKNAKWCTKAPLFVISRNHLLHCTIGNPFFAAASRTNLQE